MARFSDIGGNYFLVLIFFLPFLYLIFKKFKSSSKNITQLPPGPNPWPILGNIPHIANKMPHIALSDLSKNHGPLMLLHLGTQKLVVASSPAAAKEILKTHDRILSARYFPKSACTNEEELSKSSLIRSDTCSNGWNYLRTLCRAELFSRKALDAQSCSSEKTVLEMIQHIAKNEGGVVNVRELELLLAGSEKSATTLEWVMAELIKSPESMKKVIEELNTVVGVDSVKESHLVKLSYLHVCIKETLRLHPPGPLLLPRRARETCQVMNYTIPKDAQVYINNWAMGRDPSIWDEPLMFKPERFLNVAVDFKGNDFEYLPFGGGRRICIGLSMVERHVPLILAMLLHSFDLSLPNGKSPQELDMTEKFGVSLKKKQPLLLIAKQRK